MTEQTPTSSGVQDLISRIRDEGVQAGKQEAEQLLANAQQQAARIVEEAGFKGIWGSGLAISAQHAVRDNNELSWTQVLQQLEFMSDATTIPPAIT